MDISLCLGAWHCPAHASHMEFLIYSPQLPLHLSAIKMNPREPCGLMESSKVLNPQGASLCTSVSMCGFLNTSKNLAPAVPGNQTQEFLDSLKCSHNFVSRELQSNGIVLESLPRTKCRGWELSLSNGMKPLSEMEFIANIVAVLSMAANAPFEADF